MTNTLTLLAQTRGMEAISEGNGIGISITGMAIVFFALTIISLFIRLLPEMLKVMEPILPRLESHTQPPTSAEQTSADHERIIAAIGYVLHMESQRASQSK